MPSTTKHETFAIHQDALPQARDVINRHVEGARRISRAHWIPTYCVQVYEGIRSLRPAQIVFSGFQEGCGEATCDSTGRVYVNEMASILVDVLRAEVITLQAREYSRSETKREVASIDTLVQSIVDDLSALGTPAAIPPERMFPRSDWLSRPVGRTPRTRTRGHPVV